MKESNIPSHKITRPIQLLAAWLSGLIIVNASFLTAANTILEPEWLKVILVLASVINVPLFIASVFLLQTKFRPEMQEDSYYSLYLHAKNKLKLIGEYDASIVSFTENLISEKEQARSIASSSEERIGLEKDIYELRSNIEKISIRENVAKEILDDFNDHKYMDARLSSKCSIIVVDDNHINLKLLSAMLSEYQGNHDLAENGEEAWDLYIKGHYDLILADVHMPVLGGIDLAIRIRDLEKQDHSRGRIPLIAVTADATKNNIEACMRAGFDNVCLKPITSGSIDSILRQYLPTRRNS